LREFIQSGKHKLIVDLRGNPGGYLDAAWDISSWFLPSGEIIVTEDFGGKNTNKLYVSKGYNLFNSYFGSPDKYKIIVLVDGGSASASEIMAGALQENGIAKLVGTKTFGKGSVQELVPITSKTGARVQKRMLCSGRFSRRRRGECLSDCQSKHQPRRIHAKSI
jgi:carboxyl-terminal processing protease